MTIPTGSPQTPAHKPQSITPSLVTRDMGIMKIVNTYPETAEILMSYGFHCLGCMAAQFESLDQGAHAHGMTEDDIVQLVEDLNTVIDMNQAAGDVNAD